MIYSNENTDLMLNCIEQIKILSKQLFTELEYYKKTAKANRIYIDIKQKQINTLDSVGAMFTNIYENIETDFIEVNIEQNKQSDAIFKLEACLVYYGLSLAEINQFTQKSCELIANDLKRCIAERWRQVPICHKKALDERKMADMWENYTITMNTKGESFYNVPKPREIKTSNVPLLNWKQILAR